MTVVNWILRILVALAFLLAAGLKLVNPGETMRAFGEWGFPGWFGIIIATLELLCAVGLLVPKTATPAAGVLTLVMLGAIFTHFSRGDTLIAATPAIVLLLFLGLILVLGRRERAAISL